MATGVVVPLDGRVRAAFVAAAKRRWPALAPRHAETLYLLCTGRTIYKELAPALCVTMHTVKEYCSRAYATIGAADTTQAVIAVWPLFVAAERAAARQEAA